MFTMDTESGFQDVVFITSSYGLGETVVQGAVNPDEFYVRKPALQRSKSGHPPQPGLQAIRMVRHAGGKGWSKLVKTTDTPPELRNRYSLTDEEVAAGARSSSSTTAARWTSKWGRTASTASSHPAGPSRDGEEPGRRQGRAPLQASRALTASCCEGVPIGQKIGTRRSAGPLDLRDGAGAAGDVLVTDMTDPNWGAGDEARQRHRHQPRRAHLPRGDHRPRAGHPGGGRLRRRHRARLKDGQLVTVACSEGDTGYIYDGLLEMEVSEVQRGDHAVLAGQDHDERRQPAAGLRLLPDAELRRRPGPPEFIINNNIGVHPKAILDYPNVDADLKKAVDRWRGHASRAPSTSTS